MRSSSDIATPTLTLPHMRGSERKGRSAGEFFSQIGFDHALVFCDLAGACVCDQLAMMEDEHALGQRKDHLHHMLDDEDRDAAPGNAADERKRAIDLARIETGIDLIEHEQLRP